METHVEEKVMVEKEETIELNKEEFLDDLEYLADKATKYARSKSSINTHHRINIILQRYGLDKRLL